MKKNIQPGQTYKCRNGATAAITAVDCPGPRPVRATITGDGSTVPYHRWYDQTGAELAAARKQSPYDLVEEIQ